MQLKSKLKPFACSKCPFETNTKADFKEHIESEHPFNENNLAVKDLLLEGPQYGQEVILCPNV